MIEEYLDRLPKTSGVYMMKDDTGKIIYIGKAKNLRMRVRSYFLSSSSHAPKIQMMVKKVTSIDFTETFSEVEALVLESRLIKEVQPKYNTRQKDSKSYPYIAITKEAFPKVLIVREHEYDPKKVKLFGPYVDASGLKLSMKILQKIFTFRICNLKIDKNRHNYRPCLLAFIGYCSAPCAGKITEEVYKKDIEGLKQFLRGKRDFLLKDLYEEMQKKAKVLEFEAAAKLRDQIKALESLDKQSSISDFLPGELLHVGPEKSLELLKDVLNLKEVPKVIEGIDIAHHGGKDSVGSLVTFVDGLPSKKDYRRYQIKGSYQNNDYIMLQEVIFRRFSGQDRDRKPPDILLVDGGKGQLNAVVKILKSMNLMNFEVISLAKKAEEIYTIHNKKPLDLASNSIIHHLLCYVRDEAHRFAQSYHHYLKSQSSIKRRKNRGRSKTK